MKIDKNKNAVGFKDMHPMQIECLMHLITMCLNLANQLDDDELFEDVQEYGDETIRLFGGVGLDVEVHEVPWWAGCSRTPH